MCINQPNVGMRFPMIVLICLITVPAKVVEISKKDEDFNNIRKPLPAIEMRKVFMDSMGEQIEELKKIRGYMSLVQAELAAKKMSETTIEDKQNATIMKTIRLRDHELVSEGVEGVDAINTPVSDFMYQSDMILSNVQSRVLADAARQSMSESPTRSKRQAQTGPMFPKNQWSVGKAIPYYFHSSIDDKTRKLIRKAIKYWEEHTCLTFKENGPGSPRVKFFQGGGCFSQVGKAVGTAEQVISIGRGCEQFGIITHEIAHTLGFYHSQSRYDRDDFVRVVYSNLTPQMAAQFAKQTSATNNNYGVPYDYGSVMHYADTDTSKGVVTMLANDKIYQHTMGNNVGPSFADLLAMNIYYNCIPTCQSGIVCKNSGFRMANNCDRCVCPSGFGGDDCSELQKGEFGAAEDCGQVIEATSEWQTLSNRVTSPKSTLADRHAACYWHILAKKGQRVQMKVTGVYGACSTGCFYSGLEIKVRKFSMTGSRVCCQSDADNLGYLETEGNLAVLMAYTAYRTRGFRVKFKAVGSATTPEQTEVCQDKQDGCGRLQNLCSHARYYKLMSDRCTATCQRCSQTSATVPDHVIRNQDPTVDSSEPPKKACDDIDVCAQWKENGFCSSNFYTTELKMKNCGKTCGLC